jgi:hypothetical protein
MLAIGIKNSILVFLIVMILHFLIKNTLMDKVAKVPKVPKVQQETFKVQSDIKVPEKTSACAPAPPKNEEEEKEELLKYVFGDSGSGSNEGADGLGDFFKGKDVTQDLEGELAKRKPVCDTKKTDDQNLPLSTTCDPGIMSLKPLDNMSVKADCDIKQKVPLMTLKEYDNESTMNGGKLYGGLDGYDHLAGFYEDYACGGL